MTDKIDVRGSDGSCGLCGGRGIILPVIPPIRVPCQHEPKSVTYLVDSALGCPTVSGYLFEVTMPACTPLRTT